MALNTAVFHRSQHLSENMLEPADPMCPFCNGEKREPELTLQQSPEILLLQCKSCHSVSASRMPTDEALAKYYGEYYETSASASEQVTFDAPERLAKKLANMYITCGKGPSVSILDFGGGDGTIAYLTALHLIKRGVPQVKITVVDYNKTLLSSNDSRITLKRRDSLEGIGDPFDLVIASAVIEHHPHPRVLIQDLFRLIDDGGLFYARTPYTLPLMKLFSLIGIKLDFTYPAHVHDLGQGFWENYFASEQPSQFNVLKSRPSIVQTTISKHFLTTIAAHLFKVPWYLIGKSYKLVGGWEVFARKNTD